MSGKLSRCPSLLQVLIKHLAQVFSPTIGSQDLDGLAVVLCNSPCLEHLIGFKSLILGVQEEGGGVPGGVVSEGDEVPSVLASGDGGWSPDVGMYLISEVLGWWTNPYFRYWEPCGAREYARVTVHFR